MKRTDHADGDRTGSRHWTTIVLEERGDCWRATQTGVDVEGRGDTAAEAAARYCRTIEEGGR